MSDAQAGPLGRVALLLLAASVLRFGLGSRAGPPHPSSPDVLPGLLAESRGRKAEEAARSAPLGPQERLDPNQASAADLDRLPGVGPSTAAALVRSREEEGPFVEPEDLLRVRGVGPKLLERIRPHLAIAPRPGSPRKPPAGARHAPSRASGATAPAATPRLPRASPLDLNRADTLALQELPGVGPALARRIVRAREEAPFRTVDDLLRVRGIGPATLARLRPLVVVSR